MVTPRTKAGADFLATPAGQIVTGMREAIRAIEDEMLDKVAAAVDAMPWEYRGIDVVVRVKRAIEDIRKEASDGR